MYLLILFPYLIEMIIELVPKFHKQRILTIYPLIQLRLLILKPTPLLLQLHNPLLQLC